MAAAVVPREESKPPASCAAGPRFSAEKCASDTVAQHRVIIIALSSCPFTTVAVADATHRLAPIGIVPSVFKIDDGSGVAQAAVRQMLAQFSVRDYRTGAPIRSEGDMQKVQGGARADTVLYPQVFWRQETGRRDNDMAWAYGTDQIRSVVSGAIRLYASPAPQADAEIAALFDRHPFIVFGYDWCGKYKQVADALRDAGMDGYFYVSMDKASDDAKRAVAARFAAILPRPVPRFTSPLVYSRGTFAGNGDETLAWISTVSTLR